MRRGLARTYVVVAVPWVAWFGYQILNVIAARSYWYWRDISHAFWFLLIVPIGAPILYVLIVWVIAGFREPASQTDYQPLIALAVSQLTDNNVESRQRLYDRALVALTTQLQQQNPPLSASRIANETLAFSAATRRIERDALAEAFRHNREIQKLKPASTILLILSLGAPVLWANSFNEMSLYWIARRAD
ncbi:MAG: hypothetical protein ABSD08_09285 [Xanthobacteraceae bacterium]